MLMKSGQTRVLLTVHDGLGLWLCARRLHQGRFRWVDAWRGERLELSAEQLRQLVAQQIQQQDHSLQKRDRAIQQRDSTLKQRDP